MARPAARVRMSDEVLHPIARGRRNRASREDCNPKLARSPPVRQGKKPGGGFGDIKEEEVTQNDPVGQVEEPEERSAEAGALRASVVAQRKGIIPEDSADAPTHPIARGRRVRASREEIAKIFRPPVGGESMLQRLRRRMSKETTTAEASATGGS